MGANYPLNISVFTLGTNYPQVTQFSPTYTGSPVSGLLSVLVFFFLCFSFCNSHVARKPTCAGHWVCHQRFWLHPPRTVLTGLQTGFLERLPLSSRLNDRSAEQTQVTSQTSLGCRCSSERSEEECLPETGASQKTSRGKSVLDQWSVNLSAHWDARDAGPQGRMDRRQRPRGRRELGGFKVWESGTAGQ